MKVHIRLISDEGNVVLETYGDAMKPLGYKTPYEKPVEDEQKRYKLFAITYQPTVVLNPPRS